MACIEKKPCPKCGTETIKKRWPYCKVCSNLYSTAARFDISFEYAKELRSKIECEICTLPFKDNRDQHIDHCHDTGSIRGVLCRSCNVMLGYAKNNTQVLKNGVKYLKNQMYVESSIEDLKIPELIKTLSKSKAK